MNYETSEDQPNLLNIKGIFNEILLDPDNARGVVSSLTEDLTDRFIRDCTKPVVLEEVLYFLATNLLIGWTIMGPASKNVTLQIVDVILRLHEKINS